MPSYPALKAELAGPAYAALSAAAAADLLNAPGPLVPAQIPPNQLLIFMAKTGARKRLEDAKAHPTLAPLVLTLIDMLGAANVSLDPTNPDNMVMIDTLVAGGIATRAQVNEMIAAASRPGPSAAVRVFGVPVSPLDVAHARSLT